VPTPPKDIVLSKKDLGRRLRTLRNSQGMTQAQLADLLGARSTNISDVERGDRGVTVQQIVKLARALNVSADDILGLTKSHARKNGKMPSRMDRIETLPRSKQRALFELIDGFLDRQAVEGRRGR
jgi:transcriptional regulator with XRE-family HTH domain